MKIQRLELQDFMIFQKVDTSFSPNINIICGENGTGKTALIKLLYSCLKSCEVLQNIKGDVTKEKSKVSLSPDYKVYSDRIKIALADWFIEDKEVGVRRLPFILMKMLCGKSDLETGKRSTLTLLPANFPIKL